MAKQVYTTGQILTAAQMTTLQANDFNQTVSAKVASYTLVAADVGTRITMNNASATTVTVNTAIFAAGDTLEITNIGAGVCTVTAGTATVSTSSTLALKQFDSGQLYFTSTGVAIFFASDAADGSSPLTTKGDLYTFSTVDARLGVGANNTVLVADSAEATGLKWAAPASASFVGARVFNSAVQSISASTFTTVTFDSETFDTDGFHSTSTNTGRFTIPAGKAGKYEIYFRSQFNSTDNNGRREFICTKNSTSTLMQIYSAFSTRDNLGFQGTTIQELAVNDFIFIEVFQGSAGSINLDTTTTFCEFSIVYLGA